MEKDRFVDDLLGGTETREGVKLQVDRTTFILGRGGFSLKIIVNSGIKPCEKASSDGETGKMLGYKWTTEPNLLSLGLGELNLHKKVRESKKPNLIPICSKEGARNVLKNVSLTKRTIQAKVAEFYDPCGFWEPIKIKLAMLPMKGLEWDEKISDSEQARWFEILLTFVELNNIQMPRCSIPSDEESTSKIRIICLSDAAEFAGGAVLYAGRKLKSGDWSCSIQVDGCYNSKE